MIRIDHSVLSKTIRKKKNLCLVCQCITSLCSLQWEARVGYFPLAANTERKRETKGRFVL